MSSASSRIGFRIESLRGFLREFLGTQSAVMDVARIGGGQSNPTYFVNFGSERMVLRKKPVGQILPGAHSVEREFRVMRALQATDVPVPHALVLCEDSAVLGTPFYLMERLEGRVFADCSLPELDRSQRAGIYYGLADAMAKLHSVDPAKVGLGDFGKPGNYFERQIRRWSGQYRDSESDDIPALDEVIDWLTRNLPADDERVSIAHGDFRIGNMMYHPDRPEVIGILDWELATLGHPLADLAFSCIPWHSRPEEYGGIRGLDQAALGIPDEAHYVARYFRSAIPTSALQRFHVVFALFRFSVIFYGIADRARSGNASSENAAQVGLLARRFAERAREAVTGKANRVEYGESFGQAGKALPRPA
ncbi:phosphotransferase [bacterium]|nr:phosphotransferase [bacterium]